MVMGVQVTVLLSKTLYASRVLYLPVLLLAQQLLTYVDVTLDSLVQHGPIFGARSSFNSIQ